MVNITHRAGSHCCTDRSNTNYRSGVGARAAGLVEIYRIRFQRCGSFLIYRRLKPSATWIVILFLCYPQSLFPPLQGEMSSWVFYLLSGKLKPSATPGLKRHCGAQMYFCSGTLQSSMFLWKDKAPCYKSHPHLPIVYSNPSSQFSEQSGLRSKDQVKDKNVIEARLKKLDEYQKSFLIPSRYERNLIPPTFSPRLKHKGTATKPG